MSDLRLIVGLGNPGKDYEGTRHNLGFMIVRRLAEQQHLKFSTSSLTSGLEAQGLMEGQKTILLQPLTFVNHSGIAVKSLVTKRNIELSSVLVVCDDLDTEFGQLRIKPKGSDGGHNGLTSIIGHLGSGGFARLRCGIGRPTGKKDTVNFVLAEFTKQEKKVLNDFVEEATACCLLWLKDGINKAMDQFNKRKKNGKNGTDE